MTQINVQPRLKAFLDLIAWSEGTSTSRVTTYDGYDVIVSGVDGAHVFTDFSSHPFAHGRPPILVRPAGMPTFPPDPKSVACVEPTQSPGTPALYSTASGRYQIELETWTEIAAKFALGTFSPRNQDIAATELVQRRHATGEVISGEIGAAINLCALEWASFPGNDYKQGGKGIAALLAEFNDLLRLEQQP